MRLKYVICGCGLLIVATAQAAPVPTLDDKIIEIGMKGIQKKLKDPESARFRDLSVHKGDPATEGVYYLCGQVNSKNGCRGYVGFLQFYAEVAYLDKEDKGISGPAGVITPDMDGRTAEKLYRTTCSN